MDWTTFVDFTNVAAAGQPHLRDFGVLGGCEECLRGVVAFLGLVQKGKLSKKGSYCWGWFIKGSYKGKLENRETKEMGSDKGLVLLAGCPRF